jgi:hypothetical protein
VAGPDIGAGSPREHAVWALTDYGFRGRAEIRRQIMDLVLALNTALPGGGRAGGGRGDPARSRG